MNLNSWHNTELVPDERARLLLREMTLDEKVAQINCVFPFDTTYQDIINGCTALLRHIIAQEHLFGKH